MKLPFTLNLDIGNNKDIAQDIIKKYGKSKSINQIGLSVLCECEGVEFEILQFNSSRNLLRFCTSN